MTYTLFKTGVLGSAALASTLITSRPIHVPTTISMSHTAGQVTSTIPTASYVTIISLVPYAARPGQPVDVQGHGFAPGETVHLIVGRASLSHTTAAFDGSFRLRAAYTVPYTARSGFVRLSVIGDQSQQAAWQRLYVIPLQTWAVASAYAVHPGDRVKFDLNGFAARETIDVYQGSAYLGHSAKRTDVQGHVAGVGPFRVQEGVFPTYTFVGTRSGARSQVTLTMLQK